MSVLNRLRELGLELPAIPEPVGNYVPCVRVGDLLFLSGQGPWRDDKWMCLGSVDTEVTLEQAYDAAKVCALGTLAVMQRELESLDKVNKIVRVTGYVNSDRSFRHQPKVLNGASDIFERVLGDRGRHARSAIGVTSLYHNISVEIDVIAQVTM